METSPYSTNTVEFNFIDKQIRIPKRKMVQWLNLVSIEENMNIDYLSYSFCSDQHLLSVNIEYLHHDYYTDIITFDLSDNGAAINGDIYISIDRVKENAKHLATTFSNELNRVVVHGLLHLIGYNDKTKKEQVIMREKEGYYLAKYNAMFHVK